MVGDSQTTPDWANLEPSDYDTGIRIVSHSNINGVTVIRISGDNMVHHRTKFPWEHRLDALKAEILDFRKIFDKIFRGGWIPHKGYGGIIPPIQELEPPLVTAAPAPDDRRRSIRAFTTVRPMRVP